MWRQLHGHREWLLEFHEFLHTVDLQTLQLYCICSLCFFILSHRCIRVFVNSKQCANSKKVQKQQFGFQDQDVAWHCCLCRLCLKSLVPQPSFVSSAFQSWSITWGSSGSLRNFSFPDKKEEDPWKAREEMKIPRDGVEDPLLYEIMSLECRATGDVKAWVEV